MSEERKQFEMSEADYAALLDASKPVPYLLGSGGVELFASPQENANRAWKRLGVKMGFDAMSVQPAKEKGPRFFTAIPKDATPMTTEQHGSKTEGRGDGN
jgi:hypothetical protein